MAIWFQHTCGSRATVSSQQSGVEPLSVRYIHEVNVTYSVYPKKMCPVHVLCFPFADIVTALTHIYVLDDYFAVQYIAESSQVNSPTLATAWLQQYTVLVMKTPQSTKMADWPYCHESPLYQVYITNCHNLQGCFQALWLVVFVVCYGGIGHAVLSGVKPNVCAHQDSIVLEFLSALCIKKAY